MYTDTNYKTKKALKDALKEGKVIRCHSPGPFPCPENGHITLEGPHYPAAHSWYAQAEIRDGKVIAIK